jgi:hypothetical protein
MKVIAIVKYVFTLVGIGMLTGTFFTYRSTRTFLEEATTANGTVVDLARSRSGDSTTYQPVVQFMSRNGERIEFISSVGSNPPSHTKGEQVEVLYLPAEPHKAEINGFFSLWGDSVILGILGGVFFLVGIGIALAGALTGRKDEYLKKHGTPIMTEFQSVELNEAVSVNGRHPFRIITQWQNRTTSELHVFISDDLWFDPSDYIKRGKKIKVFIKRNNPRKYYVDLSFLPKLAE